MRKRRTVHRNGEQAKKGSGSRVDLNNIDFIALAKKHWSILVLVLILVLALILRSYHLDYPIIGYHNMKEAHTLMEVRNFDQEGNLLQNRYDYQSSLENPEGNHSDNFPLFTWIILIVWQFTGYSIAAARLITIIFALTSIFMTYLITRHLFRKDGIAILSAFFMAVCPLFIYFGRTVFFDVPALAFSLIAVYFFLLWDREPKRSYFLNFVIFITLAALTKMVFLVFLLPIAVIFPYRRVFNKKNFMKFLPQYLAALFLPVVFMIWNLISGNAYSSSLMSKINSEFISRFFSWDYWSRIYLYAHSENFTMLGLYLGFLGFVVTLFFLKKKRARFLAAWFLSLIPYVFFVGWMMQGHNYYQLPFVPIWAIMVSFALIIITTTIVNIASSFLPQLKQRWIKYPVIYAIIVIFFFLFMYGPIRESTVRQFDFQLYGLDTAGEFVKANSEEGERVFGTGNQDTGFFWYADRQGRTLQPDLDEMKEMEGKLNYRWVFMHFPNGGQKFFAQENYQDVWNYIKETYEIRQIGLQRISESANPMPIYILLEKGNGFMTQDINQELQIFLANNQQKQNTRTYETTRAEVTLVTVG
jgi:4-amino-4-deoxy-L-arabinose transferase-like glycosyltransferase